MSACPTCHGTGEVITKEVTITLPWIGTKKLYDVFGPCPTCKPGAPK